MRRFAEVYPQEGTTLDSQDVFIDGPSRNLAATTTAPANASQLRADETLGLDPTGAQVGYVTVTPTESGPETLGLRYGTFYEGDAAVNRAGNPIRFDVRERRPASAVNITLSTTNVTVSESVTVSVASAETGDAIEGHSVSLYTERGAYNGSTKTRSDGQATLTVPANATPGNWTVELSGHRYETVERALTVRAWETPTVLDEPSQTVDADALLEDVDGDGQVAYWDAITYYEHRNTDAIQDHPEHFDFDGDGVTGTVFDALALYEKILDIRT